MKLAVSSCLLGNNVRYDGTNKNDKFIINYLSKYFEFISFCPEHLAFSTPRETIQLYKNDGSEEVRVRTVFSKEDVTEKLFESSKEELKKLDVKDLCGVIFKAKSPSCGFASTKIYLTHQSEGKKDGVFFKLVNEKYPNLPKEEEARLNDDWLKENFIMQIFALKDLKFFLQECKKFNDLVEFHTSYKYLLHSKDEVIYRELGQIVANHEKKELNDILDEYALLFEQALNVKSSIKKTVNVLEHIVGFFKKQLDSDEKAKLHRLVEEYREKIIPLITVIEAIKIYVKKYDIEFLKKQKFLEPYPRELALRSSINSGK